MIGYLVYVYHKYLKVEKIFVSEYYIPSNALRVFSKVDDDGHIMKEYFTKVPGTEMVYRWGKIWCRNKSDIELCKSIIRRHYREVGKELFEEGEPDGYKRTKIGSYKKCPHCGAQYNDNFKKRNWKTMYHKDYRKTVGMCRKCGQWFSIVVDYASRKRYTNPEVPQYEIDYVMRSKKYKY